MNTNTNSVRFRMHGLALALAGLLIIAGISLHPNAKSIGPSAFVNPLWIPVHLVILVSLVLFLWGAIGYHRRQENEAGILGHIGSALTVLGTVLTVVPITIDGFVLPGLVAANAANLVADDSALFSGALTSLFLAAGIVFSLGVIALGIATLRAGVLPKWPAILLMIGGTLTAFGDLLPYLVQVMVFILFGVGMIGMAYSLLIQPRTQMMGELRIEN